VAYSADVERALLACMRAHGGQFRKGGDEVPYAVHPIHMALILSRAGASDALIQAALLHDVVEDCEDWTDERLRSEFGDEVAQIVEQLTEDKSLSWTERKTWAMEHVSEMTQDAIFVKAADKLHNLESLAAQLEEAADTADVWKHFTGGRERTLEMSRGLVDVLSGHLPEALSRALDAAMTRVERA